MATFLWVAILVVFNFYYDFEDSYIDSFYGTHWRSFGLFIYHLISYIITCWLIVLFTHQNPFKYRQFWLLSLAGFAILGLSRGHAYSYDVARYLTSDVYAFQFTFKLMQRWAPLLFIIIPLAIIYIFWLRKPAPAFFGIKPNTSIRPYLIMLAIMAPFIFAASFDPSFLKQYPNYKGALIEQFASRNDLNYPLLLSFYELSYAFGFFVVEVFFRGFLIFAFTQFLGPHVVLPMAVTYCVLHFGKPLGEAISSFFGGYLLGILALRTRNIYGGIVIHIGIAWLMELFAYLQMHL